MMPRVLRILSLLILAVIGLVMNSSCATPGQPDPVNTAALIDQLSASNPNLAFIENTRSILRSKGFVVDYYHGNEISVDFYRILPTRGYKLILFRAHSGLIGNGTKADQQTCLFSNQAYSRTAETRDQFFNRVVKSGVDENPAVFGINERFIDRSMRTAFNRTAIIMMGCSSLDNPDMARAFIGKGASIYTGWTESVGLNYVEDVTLTLLMKLFSPEVSIETAIRESMQEKGTDDESGAELKFFPAENGANILKRLINWNPSQKE